MHTWKVESFLPAAPHPSPYNALRRLTLCGILIALGYALLFCILQAPALWYDLRPDPVRSLFPSVWGPINSLFPQPWVTLDKHQSLALAIIPLYLAFLALATLPLVFLLKRLATSGALSGVRPRSILLRVFAITLVIMLVLLFVRGLLSSDIYSYAWYARILAVHGASPLTHPPVEFPPDPEGAFYWIGWPDEPSVYGPVWQILSAGVYKLGLTMNGGFSLQVMLLRLLADVAHLINALLVWSIAGHLYTRTHVRSRATPPPAPYDTYRLGARFRRLLPDRNDSTGKLRWQVAALLFYIWNPLLLVEFAASGHNDAVMLTFLLLAFWLYAKGWWRVGAVAFALALLVKLSAIIFLPGYLWLLLWDGVRSTGLTGGMKPIVSGAGRAAQALAIALATCAAVYLPFWEGIRTLQPLVSGPANRFYLHTIAADVLVNAPVPLGSLFARSGDQPALTEHIRAFLDTNVRLIFLALFALIAIIATWRARTFSRALTAWGWVGIAAALTQGWFWPWYLSWGLAPAALSRSARLRNTYLVLCVSALLLYLEEQILGPAFSFFADWGGFVIVAPPLLYLLASLAAQRSKGSSRVRLPSGPLRLQIPARRRRPEATP